MFIRLFNASDALLLAIAYLQVQCVLFCGESDFIMRYNIMISLMCLQIYLKQIVPLMFHGKLLNVYNV